MNQQIGSLEFVVRTRPHQMFYVIVIFLSVLLLPAYLWCSELAEADLFSTDLSFDNPDQDDQSFVGHQNHLETFVSSVFFIMFLSGADPFEQALNSSPRLPSLDQKTCILRC